MSHHRIVGRRALLACAICAIAAACQSTTDFLEMRVLTMSRVSGQDQAASVGTALPAPLVVQALDSRGLGVPGVNVEWKVATGGGTVSVVNRTTDADGRSTANWTLGPTPGAQTVTAAVGIISTIFTASGTAAPTGLRDR